MRNRSARIVLLCFAVLAIGLAALYALWSLELGSRVERAVFPSAISLELGDAPPANTRDARVAAWLRQHRGAIIAAERRFKIDRRAIAGLIAYEAIVNVHVSEYGGLVRWVGPGKVRYKDSPLGEGAPASKEVEDLKLLPHRTVVERKRLLADAKWSALYIGAIMRALADVVRRDTGLDESCSPGALVTLASAWRIREADRYFAGIHERRYAIAFNFPGNWTANRSAFLEHIVGPPAPGICHHAAQ
ncbi:MAG: hypothetical protein JO199_09545 [Candidatus Eremiobacteraeota bacterium]|nr:hypothetical protein [Candidatus Eremiobacteraeota bacterium]